MAENQAIPDKYFMVSDEIIESVRVGDSLEVVTFNMNIPPYGFHIWIKIEKIVFGADGIVFYGNLDFQEHRCVLSGLVRFEPFNVINFKSSV